MNHNWRVRGYNPVCDVKSLRSSYTWLYPQSVRLATEYVVWCEQLDLARAPLAGDAQSKRQVYRGTSLIRKRCKVLEECAIL